MSTNLHPYTALATYMAVDRAVKHWDGPVNFREIHKDHSEERKGEGGGGGEGGDHNVTAFTHNFFLYEMPKTRRAFRVWPW